MVIDSLKIAQKIVTFIDDKLGEDILVLDLRDISSMCDYFVITSASSVRQTKAIADEVEDQLKEEGILLNHKEGHDAGRWILLDYGDIVVHVFHQEDRDFYRIEKIWKDAPIVNIDNII